MPGLQYCKLELLILGFKNIAVTIEPANVKQLFVCTLFAFNIMYSLSTLTH